MKLRFLSSNTYKIEETIKLFDGSDIEIIPVNYKIEELQTTDEKKLVSDKLLKAFKKTGRPIFVEHTGLYIDDFNDMPGGLTQIFWDSLKYEKFSETFGNRQNNSAIAKTLIGYCDGYKLHFFEGSITGAISPEIRGEKHFQWDCIFIPNGYSETFAEMGVKKDVISMRKIAIDNFKEFLKNGTSH